MDIEKRFKVAVLKALGMILWWVAWRMDKLDSSKFMTTIEEVDDLAEEIEAA